MAASRGKGRKENTTSNIINEKIIEAVSKFTCLWQMKSQSYSDRTAKSNSWKKVKEEVESELAKDNQMMTFTIEVLQKRWKNLRDAFCRELRICKVRSGAPGPPPKPKWPFFDRMLFIKDCVQPKGTFSNFTEEAAIVSEEEVDDVSEEDYDDSFVDEIDVSGTPSPAVSICNKRRASEGSTSSSITSSSKKLCTAPSSVHRQGKSKATSKPDVIDLELMKSMKDIQGLIDSRGSTTAAPTDPNLPFCMDIATRLSKLDPQLVSFAKLRIQEVLYHIEYPGIQPPTQTFHS